MYFSGVAVLHAVYYKVCRLAHGAHSQLQVPHRHIGSYLSMREVLANTSRRTQRRGRDMISSQNFPAFKREITYLNYPAQCARWYMAQSISISMCDITGRTIICFSCDNLFYFFAEDNLESLLFPDDYFFRISFSKLEKHRVAAVLKSQYKIIPT